MADAKTTTVTAIMHRDDDEDEYNDDNDDNEVDHEDEDGGRHIMTSILLLLLKLRTCSTEFLSKHAHSRFTIERTSKGSGLISARPRAGMFYGLGPVRL